MPGPRPAAPGPSRVRGLGGGVADTLAARSGKGLCPMCEAAAGRDAAWRAAGKALACWRPVGLDVVVPHPAFGAAEGGGKPNRVC